MADPEHVAIIKRGLNFLRQWQETHPGIQLDLRVADLQRLHLIEDALLDTGVCDFLEPPLGAELSGALLQHADLSNAYMFGATLRNADLRDADLSFPPFVKIAPHSAGFCGGTADRRPVSPGLYSL